MTNGPLVSLRVVDKCSTREGCLMISQSLVRILLAVALCSSFAWAEDRDEAAIFDDRLRLFAELSADVDAFEKQGNILKRVIRYAKPNIVHIEAARLEGERKTAEEAGSGTIIEIRGRHFVL